MLDWTQVLTYIKGRLSLPSTYLEKNDKELIDWIKLTAIPEFSTYFPDVEWTSVLPTNANYKVPGKTNIYRFFDEEQLDIYGIKNCYFSLSSSYISGHPPLGAMSFDDLPCWSLSVFKSRFFEPFSNFNKNYLFIPPNQVRVLPDANSENFVVEYEREQPPDLRKIYPSLKRLFMDLALANVGIMIGSMRSHYGDGRLSTPFGEIPLSGSDLKTEYTDMKREIIEKMADESLPPIVIDIG